MLPFDTAPACLPSAWGDPTNGEHKEHVGAGVVKTELVARTGFFAQGKIKGKLMRKRAANGAQRGVTVCLFLKIFPDAI